MKSGGISLAVLFASIGAVTIPGIASAGAFAIREQSAYFQGLSFAGNGVSGSSISSMFWNPATLTAAPESFTTEAHHSFIIPKAEFDGSHTLGTTTAVSLDDFASDAWLGSSYMSVKLSDDVTFGLAVTAPYGLSTKVQDSQWVGAAYNRSSKVVSYNANPALAFEINEQLSVAVGAQLQYMDVRLTNAATGSSAAFNTSSLAGSGWGGGATAGLTYKPFEGTEFGLGFRSAIMTTLKGDLYLPYTGSLAAGNYNVSVNLMTPETLTLSAKQRVSESFRLLGTLEWTNWSRLKAPKIELDSNGAVIGSLPYNYNDGWFAAVGGEYDFNEDLTLRAGFAYEWSPVETSTRSIRLPDHDRIWLSAGATYDYSEALSFDLGYTHIIGMAADIDIVAGHQDYSTNKGTLTGEATSSVNILSASMRYTF